MIVWRDKGYLLLLSVGDTHEYSLLEKSSAVNRITKNRQENGTSFLIELQHGDIMSNPYREILTPPGVKGLVISSSIARLPYAMISIGIITIAGTTG